MIIAELIRRSLHMYADRPAVSDDRATLTYSQAGERAHRLVNALRQAGIDKGDVVATLGPNHLCTLEEILGLALGGYARAALHAMNSGDAHRDMCTAAGARALITHAEYFTKHQAELLSVPSLKLILVHDGAGDSIANQSVLDYEAGLAGASARDAHVPVDGNTIAHLAYSSGTSGTPRASVHTHQSWVHVAVDNASFLPRLTCSDVYLAVAPLTHAASTVLYALLHHGAGIRIMGHFDAADALALIESEQITCSVMVPTMLRMLAEHPDARTRDLSSLRWLLYAGAPISAQTAQLANEVFGPVLFQTYGQSECLPVTVLTPEDHATGASQDTSLLTSAGRPILASSVKIVTDEGGVTDIGQIGEILVTANGRMREIYGDPAATTERIMPDGYVRTNDIGYLDRNGYLFVVDRKDDLIISGGFNIWPAEIENALHHHPAIVEAVAFGVPHPKWGETPFAVVVVRPGEQVTEADLISFVTEQIGSMKKPSTVIIQHHDLPRNALGKLQRRHLRDTYWKNAADRNIGGA